MALTDELLFSISFLRYPFDVCCAMERDNVEDTELNERKRCCDREGLQMIDECDLDGIG